uniref:Uncharacterized protein n=1 Tax=Vibrio tasmaniensis TaxID=212663 RepID=A0A0H3ZNH8_9VIBR|nr:hypothetical protein [Vibrio tasmaniensis]
MSWSRGSPLNWALGLRRKSIIIGKKIWGFLWLFVYGFQQVSFICPKSSRFFNHFSCQNSWVASLENRVGWLKVSLAQSRFD